MTFSAAAIQYERYMSSHGYKLGGWETDRRVLNAGADQASAKVSGRKT